MQGRGPPGAPSLSGEDRIKPLHEKAKIPQVRTNVYSMVNIKDRFERIKLDSGNF